MKKTFYYINLASVPFATAHKYEEPLAELPRHWKEISAEEYKKHTGRE